MNDDVKVITGRVWNVCVCVCVCVYVLYLDRRIIL